MSAGKYWFLVLLSLVIAALVFFEIRCESQVTELTGSVSLGEARMTQAQQQNQMLRRLLQRIAVESQHDSALVDLLAKRGIHITVTPRQTDAPAPVPQLLPTNAAPPQKVPSAASHPPLTP